MCCVFGGNDGDYVDIYVECFFYFCVFDLVVLGNYGEYWCGCLGVVVDFGDEVMWDDLL